MISAVAPNLWVTPIINSLALPAHAQTSTGVILNDIQDIQIIGQQDDSDPRVTFRLTPNTDNTVFTFTFDVIEGSNISQNTVLTLINNPTVGARIGSLFFSGRNLIWSIQLSRLSPNFLDVFPTGTFLIVIQAENPDGSRAQNSFNISFI